MRRALVTGASSGIGEATARLLAQSGYRVALLARRKEILERLKRELPPVPAGEHIVLAYDLCDRAAIAQIATELEAAFGGLDLLVNNAGIGYRALVEELEAKELERVFETNVVALLLLCQALLPLLRRGQLPVVINISSVVGRRGIPGQAAYSATKAAVSSIGEALRVEWARERIAVCTLEPALTATGFFAAQANPSQLADPDLSGAAPAEAVAAEVLALDRHPLPQRTMRWKWRLLALISLLSPRWGDRLLVSRLGGSWSVPER